eukprot:436378-Rhodomonas_salina.1
MHYYDLHSTWPEEALSCEAKADASVDYKGTVRPPPAPALRCRCALTRSASTCLSLECDGGCRGAGARGRERGAGQPARAALRPPRRRPARPRSLCSSLTARDRTLGARRRCQQRRVGMAKEEMDLYKSESASQLKALCACWLGPSSAGESGESARNLYSPPGSSDVAAKPVQSAWLVRRCSDESSAARGASPESPASSRSVRKQRGPPGRDAACTSLAIPSPSHPSASD